MRMPENPHSFFILLSRIPEGEMSMWFPIPGIQQGDTAERVMGREPHAELCMSPLGCEANFCGRHHHSSLHVAKMQRPLTALETLLPVWAWKSCGSELIPGAERVWFRPYSHTPDPSH